MLHKSGASGNTKMWVKAVRARSGKSKDGIDITDVMLTYFWSSVSKVGKV